MGVSYSSIRTQGFTPWYSCSNWHNCRRENCNNIGDYIEIAGDSGIIYAAAVKSTDSDNPVFVSIGHKVSLDFAVGVTVNSCYNKIPEVIKIADELCKQSIKDSNL